MISMSSPQNLDVLHSIYFKYAFNLYLLLSLYIKFSSNFFFFLYPALPYIKFDNKPDPTLKFTR